MFPNNPTLLPPDSYLFDDIIDILSPYDCFLFSSNFYCYSDFLSLLLSYFYDPML